MIGDTLIKKTRLPTLRRRPSHRLYRCAPLPLSQAVRTKVYTKRQFLNSKEIDTLLSLIRSIDLPAYTSNPEQDIAADGTPVHTTTYLNSGRTFSNKFQWLKDRILELDRKANVKNKWGFDIHSSQFNIRVAEYHEMEKSGSLNDVSHYDVGSLVTVDIMLEGTINTL